MPCIARTGLLMLVVGCSVLLSGCTNLFFYPHSSQLTVPSDYGYHYTDVTLTTPDNIQLHAWLMDAVDEPVGLVYYLHGNAENISTHTQSIHWLLDSGYQVFALDYRGYGQSGGKPGLPEIFTDIETGMTWLAENTVSNEQHTAASPSGNRPFFMLGQSLGAALTVKYLDLYPDRLKDLDGVILEAGFSRYGAVARHAANGHWLTWSFQLFAEYLMPRRYDPVDAIASLAPTELLLIHSKDDRIVPFWQGQQLFEAAGSPKTLVPTHGPHIAGFRDQSVRAAILNFLHEAAAP